MQRVEVGLGVGRRRHTHPLRHRSEPAEPVDGGLLTGTGVGGGTRARVRGVVDDVAVGHRVDGDQKVGVDGQTQRPGDLPAGIDLRVDRELHRGQHAVEAPAGGQRGGEFVVGQPHRGGAAWCAGGQSRAVGQRPEHRQADRAGDVRWHRGVERLAGGGVGSRVRRNPEHRQQETRVVEPGGRTVVRGAVDVDHHGVDAGLLDVQRGPVRRAQRIGQPERNILAASHFRCDGDEVGHRLVLVDVAGQVGAKRGRRRDGRAVFEPDHDVAYRAVTDVADRAGDGHHRLAGGGDDVGGHLVDLHLQEVGGARLGVGDADAGDGQHGQQQRDHCTEQPSGRPAHGPCPQPFVRRPGWG